VVCGCVVVALFSAPVGGGLKQQGPCKLKVGGRAPPPVPPPMVSITSHPIYTWRKANWLGL